MKIYHYTDTGEYKGETDARVDPLDANNYLIPRNATTQAPPQVGDNQAAIYDGQEWSIEEDHRGTQYWLADEYDSEEPPHTVESIGALPEGALLTKPDVPENIASERLAKVEVTPMKFQIAVETLYPGLLDTIEAIVDAQPRTVQIAWHKAQGVKRDDPTLEAMRQHPAIDKTPAEVDDIFRLAATL